MQGLRGMRRSPCTSSLRHRSRRGALRADTNVHKKACIYGGICRLQSEGICVGGGELNGKDQLCLSKFNFFLVNPAIPRSPTPIRTIVAGSGTGAVP